MAPQGLFVPGVQSLGEQGVLRALVGTGTSLAGTVTATLTDHAEEGDVDPLKTTFNWTAKNFAIGSPGPFRLVVAVLSSRVGANTTSVASSVTIGGVAATLIVDGRNTNDLNLSTQSVWQALVPTGTAATISATFSAPMLRAAVAVYSVIGSSGVSSSAAFGTGSTPVSSETLVVPQGGAAIIGSLLSNGIGAVVTATGYTLDLQAPDAFSFYSTGSDHTPGTRTYTSTWAGATTPLTSAGVAVTWKPIGS